MLARKHDGTYRMCIDFRKLVQYAKKDAIPLPRTDDLLEALGKAQWTVMPFGLTNGPASFTRLMNLALSADSGLIWTHYLVYLDDIII